MAEAEDQHDRFLRKNQAMSRAYEISRKDKIKDKIVRGEQKPVITICYRCKKERFCMKYHIAETGRAEGAVSVLNEYVPLCEECSPKRKKNAAELSPKQIHALLRGAMHGRI